MTLATQIFDYRFPNTDLPIMRLQVRVAEIARVHGFCVENFIDDGLGEAQAILLKLPSGRVVLLIEHQHLIEHHKIKGPTVSFDAGVVAELGVGPLIGEVLTSLDLSQQAVDWVPSSEQQQIAIDLVKRVAAYKNKR